MLEQYRNVQKGELMTPLLPVLGILPLLPLLLRWLILVFGGFLVNIVIVKRLIYLIITTLSSVTGGVAASQ